MSSIFGGSATGGKGGMQGGAKSSSGKTPDMETIRNIVDNGVLIKLGLIWLLWESCK